MSSPILASKDPSDIVDYAIDWGTLLAAEGEDGIATSTWSASSPTGLTVGEVVAPSIDGMKTIVWVSGGTAGVTYTVTNTIVTDGTTPRTHERSIHIPCVQR